MGTTVTQLVSALENAIKLGHGDREIYLKDAQGPAIREISRIDVVLMSHGSKIAVLFPDKTSCGEIK